MFKLLLLLGCVLSVISLQAAPPAAPPTPAAAAPPPPPCPDISPLHVGPLKVEFGSRVSLDQILKQNPNIERGGRHRPRDCVASQKVAVIIPFRDREEHLEVWLHYLHPILQRQQNDYRVYVVHQHGDGTFNRAKLMNVGYLEAQDDDDYDCFVFSDVDLIPMDDRNIYGCSSQPRHLIAGLEKWNFGLLYHTYYGGVIALNKEQFLKINGFPNNYWGWGGEDDDIYRRIVYTGMSVSRPDGKVGHYRNIHHERDKLNQANPKIRELLRGARRNMAMDGLNHLSYKVLRTTREPLYTNVTVDIGNPPPP